MTIYQLVRRTAAGAAVAMALALCIGCDGETTQRPADPQAQGQAEKTEPPSVPAQPPQAKVDEEATPTEPKVPEKPAMVPLAMELPKPRFEGTPPNARESHMEKPLGRPRPPMLVPEGTVNVALDKPVACSDSSPVMGDSRMVTDGDKEGFDSSALIMGPRPQYVQIDLGAVYEIYAIAVWHFHGKALVCHDVVVQVASKPSFIEGVRTLFNNDFDNSSGQGIGTDLQYVETSEGKLIDAQGVQARYVRLYTNGNSVDELNYVTEVEVYGKPAK